MDNVNDVQNMLGAFLSMGANAGAFYQGLRKENISVNEAAIIAGYFMAAYMHAFSYDEPLEKS